MSLHPRCELLYAPKIIKWGLFIIVMHFYGSTNHNNFVIKRGIGNIKFFANAHSIHHFTSFLWILNGLNPFGNFSRQELAHPIQIFHGIPEGYIFCINHICQRIFWVGSPSGQIFFSRIFIPRRGAIIIHQE